MSLIQVRELSIEFGGNYILRDISCTVEHNSRLGLIGPNGCGKSTLIKLMLGELNPTLGTVSRSSKAVIAYLPQNAQPDQDLKLVDYVKSARPDLIELRAGIEKLSSLLDTGGGDAVEAQLHQMVDRFTSLGGYEWDNELKHVLLSLSFPEAMWQQSISSLSGGEQTRLCLAAMLLKPHDLLILDEPTNHLDLAMIGWLEKYLLQQDKPYLLVSHDRSFLDNTVTGIYNLRDGHLSVTKGNYSSWKEADEIARLSAERQYERQQKHINETMEFIRKNMAGQKTNQAKSRLKQLERMDIVERPQAEKQLRIRLDGSSRSGNDLFVFKDISFSAGEKLLATQVNLLACYQQRICVIGPNGCGKTTLLRMLIGKHAPDSGLLKTGASLKIAYYDQHHVDLDGSLTVMDTLWQLVPDAPKGYVLSWLARFGFRGDDVDKSVSVLSGGEKSRLYLSVLIHSKPNLLIMDEPTNHLDIQMADALLEALLEFEGSIIFVSHDRWFLSRLATRFWVFRKLLNGNDITTTVEEVDGSSDEAIELSFSVPEPPKAAPVIRERKRRINPRLLEMKHAEIENRQQAINGLRDELHSVQASLSLSSTYNDPNRLKDLRAVQDELQNGIASVAAEIERLEHEYLELLCEE